MSRFELSIADCKQTIGRARAIGSLALECAALCALGNTLFWAHRLDEMQAVLANVLGLAERTGREEARFQALALMSYGHVCGSRRAWPRRRISFSR